MEILDADRIAELVDAARDGQLPDVATEPARRAPRMRTVDFSRPTKFGADHQRRMNRATETFCLTANTRLSSELRWPLELELVGTTQLTWSATNGEIAPASVLAVLELEPTGTKLLLTIEQSLIIVCLECLLGGTPDRPPRDRRLSEIDWTLARGLVESIVGPLSVAWQELAGVTVKLGDVGLYESGQVAVASEPTFASQIEARINQQSYALSLLVPWAAIESVEGTVAGREETDGELDRPLPPLQEPMGAVPVTVRAEVAHVEMSAREILGLTPGMTIALDASAQDGVEVYADSVLLARGRPGRQNSRRAVQLTEYAREGR